MSAMLLKKLRHQVDGDSQNRTSTQSAAHPPSP